MTVLFEIPLSVHLPLFMSHMTFVQCENQYTQLHSQEALLTDRFSHATLSFSIVHPAKSTHLLSQSCNMFIHTEVWHISSLTPQYYSMIHLNCTIS